MQMNAQSLKTFYASPEGAVTRDILTASIKGIWPDLKGLRTLGCGYAMPYLDLNNAERIIAAVPYSNANEHWPEEGGNKLCSCAANALPFETNSIDRVLLVHGLQYTQNPCEDLTEIYRVLKSNGRLIIITPNRSGLWARGDWSPWGQGRPFSRGQLLKLLDECQFTIEKTKEALYTPPLRNGALPKIANAFEKFGKYTPLPGGVHIVEASKEIYARADKGTKAPALVKPFIPKPAANPLNRADHQG